MDNNSKYKILKTIGIVGVIVCFVGFTLSGIYSVENMSGPFTVLPWFFGFPVFGILAIISSNPDKNKQQTIIHESRTIKRCLCGTINDEDAVYCKKCGDTIDFQNQNRFK